MKTSCCLYVQIQECASCGPQDNMLDVHRSQICAQCLSRRRERREIVQEIVDTEMNYGRDLNILKEVSFNFLWCACCSLWCLARLLKSYVNSCLYKL